MRPVSLSFTLILCAILIWPLNSQGQRKKKEKEITQTLQLPPDPPDAVKADITRLTFLNGPLSGKGLLSQQMRDGIKAIWSSSRGAQIVKIRAFVAGSGDMRRVSQIVSDMFADRKQALPAVSVVQVGALPLEGAQVALEVIAVDKKAIAPEGLAFISGQTAPADEILDQLKKVLNEAKLPNEAIRRVSCFLPSVEGIAPLQGQLAKAFPKAGLSLVQLRRDFAGNNITCEAIASLTGGTRAPTPSIVSVPSGFIVLSGLQLAFGNEAKDARLAFQRLSDSVAKSGGSLKETAMVNSYVLTRSAGEQVRSLRSDFFPSDNPPAGTLLVSEGLPSMDATFGLEVITLAKQ